MEGWKEQFNYDPLVPLISSKNKAIVYFAKRDLLEKEVEPLEILWNLPPAIKIIKQQQKDGYWRYSTWKSKLNEPENYNLLETYRQLGFLVEKYSFTKEHNAIKKAAEYIFSCQIGVLKIYLNGYYPCGKKTGDGLLQCEQIKLNT